MCECVEYDDGSAFLCVVCATEMKEIKAELAALREAAEKLYALRYAIRREREAENWGELPIRAVTEEWAAMRAATDALAYRAALAEEDDSASMV